MKLPYLKFFYGDWLRDTSLSSCSPATRGIWIDLLCRMHDAACKWKVSGTLEQLAQMARCAVPDMTQALAELDRSGSALITEEIDPKIDAEIEEELDPKKEGKNAQKSDVTQNVTQNVTHKSVTCNANVQKKNTIVTVVCRRLQREHSQRFKTKIRVRKHRSNAPVTPKKHSPSYSYSYKRGSGTVSNKSKVSPERDSLSEASRNAFDPPPIEPHPNFPRTPEQALATVVGLGAPETVVLEEWHRANAVGGCNRTGVPIRNWPSYFAACYAARRSREAEKLTTPAGSKSTGAERAFPGEARSGITLKAREL